MESKKIFGKTLRSRLYEEINYATYFFIVPVLRICVARNIANPFSFLHFHIFALPVSLRVPPQITRCEWEALFVAFSIICAEYGVFRSRNKNNDTREE
jgi:hypothetical protein